MSNKTEPSDQEITPTNVLTIVDEQDGSWVRVGVQTEPNSFGEWGLGIRTGVRGDGIRENMVVRVTGKDLTALRDAILSMPAEAFPELDEPEPHGTVLYEAEAGDCDRWIYSAVSDSWWWFSSAESLQVFDNIQNRVQTSYVGFDEGAARIIASYGVRDRDPYVSPNGWVEGDIVTYKHAPHVVYVRDEDGWLSRWTEWGADPATDEAIDKMITSGAHVALRQRGVFVS